ncbi:HD domain-containing protein [Ensifer adhaerens]|uniref:HD domain-containing protein n=1 Tax=Ensifer adhaerens TaxID=106592 RepID=UPI002E0E763D
MTDTRDSRLSSWRSPDPLSPAEECAWAREVAAHAHAGQRDKAGEPYFSHCQRVADAVVGEKAKTVAFLHDVVEKSPGWTLERLKDVGFSPEVIIAVQALTRQPGETKDALTLRAVPNPLSVVVKRADLQDNLAQVKRLGRSDAEYRRRLNLLDQALQENIALHDPRDAGLARSRSALSPGDKNDARVTKVVATAALAVVSAILLGAAALAVWTELFDGR